jgi:hypothetical protein
VEQNNVVLENYDDGINGQGVAPLLQLGKNEGVAGDVDIEAPTKPRFDKNERGVERRENPIHWAYM